MFGGAIVDCPGKAVGSSDAIVTLQGVLISRVDTGGEHRRSRLTMRRCHTLEIPARSHPSCRGAGGGRRRMSARACGAAHVLHEGRAQAERCAKSFGARPKIQ